MCTVSYTSLSLLSISSKLTDTNFTRSQPEFISSLLHLLVSVVDHRPDVIPKISRAYYTYLSQYISSGEISKNNRDLALTAIRIPLVEHIELNNNGEI